MDNKDVKNLVDLGDGHWRIRVYVGRDTQGKPEWASRNLRGSLKEARSARDAFKTDIHRQQVVTMHPITLGEMLDRWLDEIEGQRARSTMGEYRRSVEKDIKPALGHIGLDKLTAQHLDRFYSGQLAKGLSPSTVHKFHAYLSAALNRAFKWELIARNPAVKASPPAAEKVPGTPAQGRRCADDGGYRSGRPTPSWQARWSLRPSPVPGEGRCARYVGRTSTGTTT